MRTPNTVKIEKKLNEKFKAIKNFEDFQKFELKRKRLQRWQYTEIQTKKNWKSSICV